jgi:hypothetical protein
MSEASEQSGRNRVANDRDQWYRRSNDHEHLGEFDKVEDNDIRLAAHYLGGKRCEAFGAAICRKALYDQIFSLYIAQFA